MESFHQLLSTHCDSTMTVRIKYLNYTVVGINPVLIFCNISHECYPDATLKILERRIVNLVKPGEVPSSPHAVSPTVAREGIKIEYICKFYGTIISNQDIVRICQDFIAKNISSTEMETGSPTSKLTSSSLPPESLQHSTSLSSFGEHTSQETSVASSKTSSRQQNEDLIHVFNRINEMKLEDLSLSLARFISQHYLPSSIEEGNNTRKTSSYIFEVVITLNPTNLKIIHCDMDILAATELPAPSLVPETLEQKA
jgi:ribosomal protein L11